MDVDVTRCSFCLTPAPEVRKLIAGPGAYICEGCVAKCVAILDENAEPAPEARLPSWASMTDEQVVDRLPRIAAVATQVETSLRGWVHEARGRGVTWTRIGAALGMSRQSAWERFSGEE